MTKEQELYEVSGTVTRAPESWISSTTINPPAPATTLSGLLEIAVDDAEACEREPDVYELKMDKWVTSKMGVCRVCLAGAVLARRYGVVEVGDNFKHLALWLVAIDCMRIGQFSRASYMLDLTLSSREQAEACETVESLVREYLAQNGRAPWAVYREAVELLKGVGL